MKEANDQQAFTFDPERPVDSPEKDLLGRYRFSQELASALCEHTGDQSLVIALNGVWGSGKTSIWKLARYALEHRRSMNSPEIVEFSLWEIRGGEALAAAFFSRLSVAIDKALDRAGQKRLRGLVLRYGERVAGGLANVKHLSEAAHEAGLPWLGFFGKLAGLLAGWLQIDRSALKRRLNIALKTLKSPIVVLFDDIDRLTAEEVSLLFRLVKANADFPRIIYVLLFDRMYAEAALEQITSGRGADFVEKIVQVTIDVPPPGQKQLQAVLRTELISLARSLNPSLEVASDIRFNILLERILSDTVRHIRDVRRYLNSLRFHVLVLTQDGAFQGDFTDLAALEAARIWMPKLYDSLPRNAGRLIREPRSSAERTGNWKDWYQRLMTLAPEPLAEPARTLLLLVFGVTESATQSPAGGELLRNRRAAHRDFFDLYFRFELSTEALTKQEIEDVLRATSSSEAFDGKVKDLLSAGRIGSLLRYLSVYRIGSATSRKNVAQTLINIADDVEVELGRPMDAYETPEALSSAVSMQILRENEGRADLTMDLIKGAQALSEIVRIAERELDSEHRKSHPGIVNQTYVGESRLDEIRSLVVEKFRELQETSLPTLGNHVQHHLRRWNEWGGKADVEAWIMRRLNSAEGFLQLIEFFSTPHIDLVQFDIRELARLVPWKSILRARRNLFAESPAHATGLIQRFDTWVELFRRDRTEERRKRITDLRKQKASTGKTSD